MAKRTCGVENCQNSAIARGLCPKHYERWRVHGDVEHVERGREGNRKYTLNESFFNDIATEVQAYWLGFLTADGGIIASDRTHALRVELSARDANHLAQMCTDLGSTKQATFRRTFACVSFDSWRLVESLGRLGIGPRKSATVKPWNGPKHLMPHYWRGMFDGDGSIYRTTRDGLWNLSLCGSEACVRAFASWAHDICGSRAVPRHAKGGCWTWTVCGGRSPQFLAQAMYGSATVYLARKRDLADELVAVDFEEVAAAGRKKQSASMRRAWAEGRGPRRGLST